MTTRSENKYNLFPCQVVSKGPNQLSIKTTPYDDVDTVKDICLGITTHF